MKSKGGFVVSYKKARHGWGRVFPTKSLGMTSFAKKTRNTLIKDLYYDFDLKNAQPEILRSICEANNLSCAIVKEYCTRREEIICNIIADSDGEANRDLVKSLIIRLSFYGGFKGWLVENNIKEFPTPIIVKKYRDEVKRIALLMKEANPDLFKTMERAKKEKGEENVMGSFLSTYLQEYELRVVENVLKHLCIETDICSTDFPNYFLAIYEFDGLKLLKSRVDAYGGVDKVLELMNRLNIEMGFDIVWELKPIEKFYDVEFTMPPPTQTKLQEKEEIKEREKERKKEEKANQLAENEKKRTEILKDKRNKVANNDLEASKIIYSEIENNIKFSNKILYYKHNYLWISDFEMIKSLLGNYIRHSGIKRLNPITNQLEDFVQHRKCGQNVLNDVIDIATVNYDNMWSNEMFKSSLGKVLFTNGYYNFHLGKFYKHADKDYDHSIIFMEYIETIKQRLFIDPFGKEVADYYLLNIARGLAGDAMKRALFGIGDGNTGKSIMTTSIEGACGGYFGTFNANNIIMKKMQSSGDDAQQLRWIMMLLSKRIIASNELEGDAVINGTILKKLSSGGLDKIVARMHGGNETEFMISFLCILFANDLDKIKPMDDAIVERVRAIPYTKKYVDKPSNIYELQKDVNLTKEVGTLKYKLGFMFLLMESYKTFVAAERIEKEPAAIGKALVSTFGGIDNFITILQEDYEITNNENDNDVSSADLAEWIKTRKLGISATKLGRDLNKYAELNNFTNVKNKDMKKGEGSSSKTKRVWVGLKQIVE
jgi:hypothetical protein